MSPISALSGATTSGGIFYSGSSGNLTITGNLSTGTATCVTIGGSVSANVYGNITGGPASNASHGINSASTGSLNVSGNVTAIRGYGINATGSATTATISVTGNVAGGTVAGQSSRGISKSVVLGSVFLLGNVYGGPSGDQNNVGLYYSGGASATLTVYGTISANAGYGLHLVSNNSNVIISGGNIFGGSGTAAHGVYANAVTNLTSYNAVYGGSVAAVYGINFNSGASNATILNNVSARTGAGINNQAGSTLNITGNVYGGGGTSSGIINNTQPTLKIIGNVIGAGGNAITNNTFNNNITITGNVVGGTTGYGINATGGDVINVFGNVLAQKAHAINLNIGGGLVVNVTGSVIGGTNGTSSNGINNPINATISVSGSIVPTNSGSSGIFNNTNYQNTIYSYGTVYGNGYGYGSNVGTAAYGIYNLNNRSFGSTSISATKVQYGVYGYPAINDIYIMSNPLSSIMTVYMGGNNFSTIAGTATNTVSSLASLTINNITGTGNTRTIAYTTNHNISSIGVLLSSTGFSDPSWNTILPIVSIPTSSSITVSGVSVTPTFASASSVLIYQTGYYGNSAIVITNGPHNLNSGDTIYSNCFSDPNASWNGMFTVNILSLSSFSFTGPTAIPYFYGNIANTKYYDNLMDPALAAKLANVSVNPVNVRSGYSYNSNTQTGTLAIPPSASVLSGVAVDNGFGVNVYGTSVLPVSSDVRANIIYGSSNSLSGSMYVPLSTFVSYGVPVDNAVGTALLDPSALWAYPLSSIQVNTIGKTVGNIATKTDIASLL
jgi:hypothetical protein